MQPEPEDKEITLQWNSISYLYNQLKCRVMGSTYIDAHFLEQDVSKMTSITISKFHKEPSTKLTEGGNFEYGTYTNYKIEIDAETDDLKLLVREGELLKIEGERKDTLISFSHEELPYEIPYKVFNIDTKLRLEKPNSSFIISNNKEIMNHLAQVFSQLQNVQRKVDMNNCKIVTNALKKIEAEQNKKDELLSEELLDSI